jgi:hypothetical protein
MKEKLIVTFNGNTTVWRNKIMTGFGKRYKFYCQRANYRYNFIFISIIAAYSGVENRK